MLRLAIAGALAVAAVPGAGAINPHYDGGYVRAGRVFDTTGVAVVRVSMSPQDLSTLHDPAHLQDNIYYPATVVFSNRYIFETVTNVGIRLRGNTSRYATRKSYKLSFNTFVPGRRFHGVRKINLNGEHNDPSLMRARLCWSLLRGMRLPASRVAHALLYINGTLFGLCANVEEIDDEFLEAHFGSNDGNLYKCLYQGAPADLTYRSDGRYDLVGSGSTYELQTNESSNDFGGLAHFIDVLNNSSDTGFADAIEQVFNVELFLRWMAVSALCGSWDDYRYNANNYFLYDDPADGRFTFIPYDYDNTLGIDFLGRNWATRDLNDWDRHNLPRPLSLRILQIPRYRRLYRQYLHELVAGACAPDRMSALATGLKAQIQLSAELSYATVPQDWGFTIADFNASLTQPSAYNTSRHVNYGILPYISVRWTAATAQLTSVSLALNEVVVSNASGAADAGGRRSAWLELHNPALRDAPLEGFFLSDDPAHPLTWPLPATNVPGRGFMVVWLDGHADRGPLHAPFVATNTMVLVLSDAAGVVDMLRTPQLGVDQSYGRYRDWSGHERTFALPTPGAPNEVRTDSVPDLRINEFMADNETTITNPVDGNFDDWIELYNAGSVNASLQGMYLSDSAGEPRQWEIADAVTLTPGSHVLIWADGHPEYGGLHAGFKLSRDGEAILLTAADGTTLVDRVLFGPQAADWSSGRFPDGAGGASNDQAFLFMSPTPDGANVPEPCAGFAVVYALLAVLRRGAARRSHRSDRSEGVTGNW